MGAVLHYVISLVVLTVSITIALLMAFAVSIGLVMEALTNAATGLVALARSRGAKPSREGQTGTEDDDDTNN